MVEGWKPFSTFTQFYNCRRSTWDSWAADRIAILFLTFMCFIQPLKFHILLLYTNSNLFMVAGVHLVDVFFCSLWVAIDTDFHHEWNFLILMLYHPPDSSPGSSEMAYKCSLTSAWTHNGFCVRHWALRQTLKLAIDTGWRSFGGPAKTFMQVFTGCAWLP